MRLVASFNLSTHGAKTDFVGGRYTFFSLFFSPSFQNKLDKMQIGSSEDVNDLNYYYDNEWWVARGGN